MLKILRKRIYLCKLDYFMAIVISDKAIRNILLLVLVVLVIFFIFKDQLKLEKQQILQVEMPKVEVPTPSLPPPGQQVQEESYATRISGYVADFDTKSPVANITVYASKVEPLEANLYADRIPTIEALAKSDVNGRYEILVMPGETYVWVWGADASPKVYPEVLRVVVPRLPPEQPTWIVQTLFVRKVGTFGQILESVGTYGATGWKIANVNGVYKVNLEGNGTAAQAAQIYDLYRHTGKYIYIQPASTGQYLKDVRVSISYVPESAAQKIEDIRFLIVSNPANVPVVVNNVKGTEDFVQFYGYLDASYPIQMNLVIETSKTATFSDGELLAKIKVDDMRGKKFMESFKEEFAAEQVIEILA